jgi:hypothetical protein
VTGNPQAGAHSRVAVRDAARVAWAVARGPVGEQKRRLVRIDADLPAERRVPLPMLGEHLDRRGVDRQPAHLVRLRVLLDRLPIDAHVVPPHCHHAAVEVDVGPAQCEQLGPAHAGHHHQPDERAPVVVLRPRRLHDARCLCDRRWIRLRGRLPRLASPDGRVVSDPFPTLGGGQHAADREVDAADRCRSERTALVRQTLDNPAARLVAVVRRVTDDRRPARGTTVLDDPALVRLARAVLDERLAVTACAAPAQLGVELLEQPRRHLADRLVAEGREDVHAGVQLVAGVGGCLDFVRPKPGLHGRPERGLRPRLTLLVNLCAEPLENRLGLGLGRDRLREPDLLAGQGVDPGVHQHLEAVATSTDVAPRATRADLLRHTTESTR